MLNTFGRTAYNEDHDRFRETVRKVFADAVLLNLDRWEADGVIDRDFWKACGVAGLLCPTVPEEYGGLGLDFGYKAVVGEEIAYAGAVSNIALHSDVVMALLRFGCVPAAAWRRRLHERNVDRASLAGCASESDRGRHVRDHERGRRRLALTPWPNTGGGVDTDEV